MGRAAQSAEEENAATTTKRKKKATPRAEKDKIFQLDLRLRLTPSFSLLGTLRRAVIFVTFISNSAPRRSGDSV